MSQDEAGQPAAADAARVRRVLQGEGAAFGELYDAHADTVYRYLLLRCRDAGLARDLTQDAFERALEALPRLREPRRFAGWLLRIARHRLLDHWDRQRRRPDAEPLDALPPDVEGQPMSETALADQLRLAGLPFEQLTERQRRLIALRFGAELSIREVAEQLGCSPRAARQLQYRALQRLREAESGGSEGEA